MAERTARLARTILSAVLLSGSLGAVLGVTATSEATPAARPAAAQDWELGFKPGALMLFFDPSDGRSYWFFTYEVWNASGQDRMFAPRVDLVSDKGEVLSSGKGVPTTVTKKIRSLLVKPGQEELLEDDIQIIGDLRQGKENARRGLVVWAANDISVPGEADKNRDPLDASNEYTVYFLGLNNIQENVPHPVTGENIRMRKTLRMDYRVDGNADDRRSFKAVSIPPMATERSIHMHKRVPNALWIWR